jgi:hypothetical protein
MGRDDQCHGESVTDDEIKAVIAELKPRTNWIGFITGAFAIASGIWAATQYFGDIPKRPEFKAVTDDVVRIRIELPVMNAKIERMEQSQARVEQVLERVDDKLADRKGRRAQ